MPQVAVVGVDVYAAATSSACVPMLKVSEAAGTAPVPAPVAVKVPLTSNRIPVNADASFLQLK